jgi:PiT family inorganic phosphate transporter
MMTVLCALVAAIGWNIFTWWLGLPSSSSHALIGGLVRRRARHRTRELERADLAGPRQRGAAVGLWPKVVLPMFTSPSSVSLAVRS